ncbi:uncharacterized protein TNCV_4431181 [Trichonephila clavipes]|nr:uncharacterized protein TNCV_4431181 [Trichonephila clavipes]
MHWSSYSKRIGARLRKLKSKNKNLSGKGKLTDSFIGRLQNYMGLLFVAMLKPIRSSAKCYCGFVSLLSSSVEKRCMGSVPSEKKIVGATTSEHKKPNEKYKGLSNEVLNTIKPTYLQKLCTKELLTKCLHGKTQEFKRVFNGVIWQKVPRKFSCALKIFKIWCIGCCDQFNDGYKGCVEIFKKLNITPGYFFTLKAYKHLDINRINDAERHSRKCKKQRRKLLRATRKKKSMF